MFVTLDVVTLLQNAEDIPVSLDLACWLLEQNNEAIVTIDDKRYLLPVFDIANMPDENEDMGVKWLNLADYKPLKSAALL